MFNVSKLGFIRGSLFSMAMTLGMSTAQAAEGPFSRTIHCREAQDGSAAEYLILAPNYQNGIYVYLTREDRLPSAVASKIARQLNLDYAADVVTIDTLAQEKCENIINDHGLIMTTKCSIPEGSMLTVTKTDGVREEIVLKSGEILFHSNVFYDIGHSLRLQGETSSGKKFDAGIRFSQEHCRGVN
jgi:hypothetical protein